MQVRDILRIKGNRLLTLSPEANMETAVALMAQEDVGSILVARGQTLLGLLTFREVLRHQASKHSMGQAISTVMDAAPLTADPEMNIMDLRAAMLARHARYVPVQEGGVLLGVLSFHDVAKAVIAEQNSENEALKSYINT